MDLSNISIINAILIGIFTIIILIYIWLKWSFSYWKRRGVPHVKATSMLFGNLKEGIYDKKKHIFELLSEIYNQFHNEPYCGLYEFHYPVLMIRDPQLIQMILVEKFNSFQSPKFTINENADEMLSHNPFVLKGSRWKETKSMLSAGLTQNKLKVLEDIFKPISKDMFKYINENSDDIETYEFATRYTSDMVSSFGWGIRSNSFSQNSTIKKMFDYIQFSSNMSFTLMLLHPFMSRILNLRFFPKDLIEFLKDITKQAVDTMEANKSNQHTFLQNILHNREKLRSNGKDMSLSEMSSYLSTLYLDGYETTGRVLSLLLYCLVLHPEMQQKIKEEVLSIGEEITIESVNKLHYMEMFLLETFRCYPLIPYLGRTCNENCKLGDLEIQKGEAVIIPISALHYDSTYYQEPDVFNPENFSEENKNARPKCTFFSFGGGPRLCLGMRYATITIKLLLANILKDYDLVPPKNHTVHPLKSNLESVLIFAPSEPMYIGFKKTKV